MMQFHWLMGLMLLATPLPGFADETCRIAFDVGSSGIRVGASKQDEQAKVSIDYLEDVWPDRIIDRTVTPTIEAFISLPKKAGLPTDCRAVAGGYSAWRFALQQGDPTRLIDTLRQIHEQTQVPLFIIPQDIEGMHGHLAARNALGERLKTPFTLDMGGGSLQIASQTSGWGTDLGQKAWRKLFCEQIKKSLDPLCAPNPVGRASLTETARLLTPRLAEAQKMVGVGMPITAISAPVVKMIHPVLRFLASRQALIPAAGVDETGFDRAALTAAIALLAPMDDAALAKLLTLPADEGTPPVCEARFLPTLVTDMLLIHTLMTGLEIERLEVALAPVTNVPGLLADPHAAAWADHYACYLRTLGTLGIEAFRGDPASCPAEPESATR
ncbi:MAG: hypothetical protein HQM00_14770 [Magnetococcales bacterium]|nr:hypothetical protein [Magnetococcales bacterium]